MLQGLLCLTRASCQPGLQRYPMPTTVAISTISEIVHSTAKRPKRGQRVQDCLFASTEGRKLSIDSHTAGCKWSAGLVRCHQQCSPGIRCRHSKRSRIKSAELPDRCSWLAAVLADLTSLHVASKLAPAFESGSVKAKLKLLGTSALFACICAYLSRHMSRCAWYKPLTSATQCTFHTS